MTVTRAAKAKRVDGAETGNDSAWETVFVGTATPACNAGYELSGGAVSTAWRNAKRMIRQGYTFRPDGIFHWHGGCVTNPNGRCYDVYLPGAYPDHCESRCSCPFFARHAICKHIYFAVHQFQAIQALPTAAPSAKAKAALEPRF